MSVVEPNLGDSKTSDTAAVNLPVIRYFQFENCGKEGTFPIHSSRIIFDLSSKLLFAYLVFMKKKCCISHVSQQRSNHLYESSLEIEIVSSAGHICGL